MSYDKTENVRLRIVNVSGQLVHDKAVWGISSGVNMLPVKLEKGLHIILLTNDESSIIGKVGID